MSPEALLRRCHELAGTPPPPSTDPESLIGFFQLFRPDGSALSALYDGLESGNWLQSRLRELYAVAGDDRRPSGGRDAYFVVRRPKPVAPREAEQLAVAWLEGLLAIAKHVGDSTLCEVLQTGPHIRVLEGIPPKHPKQEAEQSRLLRSLKNADKLVERIDSVPLAEALRPAYYFAACDAMLRDYLMWPLYSEATGLGDPLRPYFRLWEHGAKFRIFEDSQIDLYLPRHLG